eukprot:g8711.t1
MWTPGALGANAPLVRGSMHGFFPLFGHQQVRTGYTHRCTKTMLQQFYCAMPIRKRYRTALKKGTMKWCEKRGQVPAQTPQIFAGAQLSNNFQPTSAPTAAGASASAWGSASPPQPQQLNPKLPPQAQQFFAQGALIAPGQQLQQVQFGGGTTAAGGAAITAPAGAGNLFIPSPVPQGSQGIAGAAPGSNDFNLAAYQALAALAAGAGGAALSPAGSQNTGLSLQQQTQRTTQLCSALQVLLKTPSQGVPMVLGVLLSWYFAHGGDWQTLVTKAQELLASTHLQSYLPAILSTLYVLVYSGVGRQILNGCGACAGQSSAGEPKKDQAAAAQSQLQQELLAEQYSDLQKTTQKLKLLRYQIQRWQAYADNWQQLRFQAAGTGGAVALPMPHFVNVSPELPPFQPAFAPPQPQFGPPQPNFGIQNREILITPPAAASGSGAAGVSAATPRSLSPPSILAVQTYAAASSASPRSAATVEAQNTPLLHQIKTKCSSPAKAKTRAVLQQQQTLIRALLDAHDRVAKSAADKYHLSRRVAGGIARGRAGNEAHDPLIEGADGAPDDDELLSEQLLLTAMEAGTTVEELQELQRKALRGRRPLQPEKQSGCVLRALRNLFSCRNAICAGISSSCCDGGADAAASSSSGALPQSPAELSKLLYEGAEDPRLWVGEHSALTAVAHHRVNLAIQQLAIAEQELLGEGSS